MGGLVELTVQEARGAIAVSAEIDNLCVVIGCSSLGTDLSPFFLSGSSSIANLGYGDAVDVLTQCIEQRQAGGASAKKLPCAMYTTESATSGSYGAIDSALVTGSGVVVAGSSQPFGTYEAGLQWVTGGVVGTTGMVLKWTLNNGRKWSTAKALGTATSYTIPNSNVTFNFSPSSIDTTALDTLLNELKGDANAHRVLTAGSVHGAADTTNIVTAADASSTSTRVALANALRDWHEAHRILTAGGVHGAADTTNVIGLPIATDDSTALALALEIQTKYNAHIALTAGSVHGAADATNDSDSPAPAAGTFAAGDEVHARTFAPEPGATEIAAAFTALAASTIDFGIVEIEVGCTAAIAAVITTGLNALAAVGKDVVAITRTRLPDFETPETETAWGAAINADFANFEDSRISVRAAYNLVTDAVTTRQYLRSTVAQYTADLVRVPRAVWPCSPSDRAEPNVIMVDATGATVGHDEGPRGAFTGLSNDTLGNRFSCEQRVPNPSLRENVYNTVPWVMYAADERIRNVMTRRLANAMKRTARLAGIVKTGGNIFYTSTSETTGTLTTASRNAVAASVFEKVSEEFRKEIQNADEASVDSGLVQVAEGITISGGNLVHIDVILAPKIGGYILSFGLTLAIQD